MGFLIVDCACCFPRNTVGTHWWNHLEVSLLEVPKDIYRQKLLDPQCDPFWRDYVHPEYQQLLLLICGKVNDLPRLSLVSSPCNLVTVVSRYVLCLELHLPLTLFLQLGRANTSPTAETSTDIANHRKVCITLTTSVSLYWLTFLCQLKKRQMNFDRWSGRLLLCNGIHMDGYEQINITMHGADTSGQCIYFGILMLLLELRLSP